MNYAVMNGCRLNYTRVGYHSGMLYVQIGQAYRNARLNFAYLGAARLNYDDIYDALADIEWQSIQIQRSRDALPTMSFDYLVDVADRPTAGNLVVCGIGTLKNRIFLGRIAKLVEPQMAGWYRIACTVESIEKDLRIKHIYATFTAQYARDILKSLLATYAQFFTWAPGNDQGVYISSVTYRGESLYDILQSLADQSGVNTYVTTNWQVVFSSESVNSDAFDITDSSEIHALTIEESASELYTQVVILYTQLDDITESFSGDSDTEQFHTAMAIHAVTSLTVDGAAVTYGERNKEDNSTNDFSISYQEGVIYTSAHATLTSSNTLAITYSGRVNARVTVTDTSAAAAWAGVVGGDGIATKIIEDRKILSYDEAIAYAQNVLTRYNSLYYDASYTLERTVFALPDIHVGDTQTITARSRNIETTINRIVTTVFAPGAGSTLWLQYQVQLAERDYQIERDLHDITRQTEQPDDEIIRTLLV